MTDYRAKPHPADPLRINLHQEGDRKYWCKQFSCTERQLRDAVKVGGVLAGNARTYLKARS